MIDKRVALAAGALVIGSIAAAGVQSHNSSKEAVMKQEYGTATVGSGSGEIDLATVAGGVEIVRISGDLAKAGILREGDVITEVDGNAVRTPEHLLGYVRGNPGARSFEIEIRRGGRSAKQSVTSRFMNLFMTPQPPEPPAVPNG